MAKTSYFGTPYPPLQFLFQKHAGNSVNVHLCNKRVLTKIPFQTGNHDICESILPFILDLSGYFWYVNVTNQRKYGLSN
jgi:hypothetical protein